MTKCVCSIKIIVGADVSHPGPGVRNRPSIASLVASVNGDATHYTSFVGVQAPRTEIIADLEGMLYVKLMHLIWMQYYSLFPRRPSKIITLSRNGLRTLCSTEMVYPRASCGDRNRRNQE